MNAWGKDQGIEGSLLTFMADTQGTLTAALGVTMEHPGPTSVLGSPRCQRHALYVEDGIIKAFEVAASEDDPAGDDNPDVTLVENMLSKVPDLTGEEKEKAEAAAEAAKSEANGSVKSEIDADDLVLFVKEGCPFCKDAISTLEANEFTPKIIVASNQQKSALAELTGKTSLPSAWVKGTYIGGCNDGSEDWHGVKPMVANGKLKEMLEA
jgi:glutaredoxin